MADSPAPSAPLPDAGYKETLESILVAFILAFIFRAFVVEAFVIPTGSMAPTLYGAHIRFHCPDCGYVFDAESKGTDTGDDVDIPADAAPATNFHCPNCGYSMPTDTQRVRFGDRILVLKYLYLFQKPVPGDVVVFKSPNETNHDPEDPEYGQNYIKRLVGVGPESVVILDGDVYTGPFDAQSPLDANGKPLFKIQRKPRQAQEALWRPIYHSDFIPHLDRGADMRPWAQPWTEETAASGWKLSGPASTLWPGGAPRRVFNFSNPRGGGAIVFNPEANPDTHALTDFLVYDEAEHRDSRWEPQYVSDLKLSCDYVRQAGSGPLRLQLSKNADLFTAEVTPGKVRLLRATRTRPDTSAVSDERELQSAALAELSGGAPVRIELTNVDYRVSVRINDKEVLATTDADYAPNVAELWKFEEEGFQDGSAVQRPFGRPLVRIDAEQQQARIEHVALSRDVYYLSHVGARNFWGTTRRISHLKAGEYFVLGDNSFISADARYWGTPVDLPHEGLYAESGRVPKQFMLGKAFFVYWPAGYRMPFLSINAVPDFGEMRAIR